MVKEIEMKAPLNDPDKLRKKIMEIGAEFVNKEIQRSYMLDYPDSRLWKKDSCIRIRNENGKTVLCYKGPKLKGKAKIREEIEVAVSSMDDTIEILKALGIDVAFVWEKERETYKIDNVVITIDRLPKLGHFCEIEVKKEEDIKKYANLLGVPFESFTTDSYGKLIDKYLGEILAEKEFLFGEEDDIE